MNDYVKLLAVIGIFLVILVALIGSCARATNQQCEETRREALKSGNDVAINSALQRSCP